MSPAWQVEATTDRATVWSLWLARPEASIILPTGRVFDVLDVPASVGARAAADGQAGVRPGPVAVSAGDRALFFVLTRGTPADEHEMVVLSPGLRTGDRDAVSGLRWHCRDSYVLAPPSRCGADGVARGWRPGRASAARRAPPARVPRRRVRGSRQVSGGQRSVSCSPRVRRHARRGELARAGVRAVAASLCSWRQAAAPT